MSNFLVILIIAVVAVGFFVLAVSLTLIFKGHNIDSEIGTNKNMQRLGIKCAAQQMREEECALGGESACGLPLGCSSSECSTCADGESHQTTEQTQC